VNGRVIVDASEEDDDLKLDCCAVTVVRLLEVVSSNGVFFVAERLELLHFWKKRVSFTRLEDTARLRLGLGF